MKDRAEAFIPQAKPGQWMVEVWQDGTPVQCVAGLATCPQKAVDWATCPRINGRAFLGCTRINGRAFTH